MYLPVACGKSERVDGSALLAAGDSKPVAGVSTGAIRAPTMPGQLPVIFVITMENHHARQIWGDRADAPWLSVTPMQRHAYAGAFDKARPNLPSGPHDVMMQAGMNAFQDKLFKLDGDPSATRSKAGTEQALTQTR